jgi:hypothetical protein
MPDVRELPIAEFEVSHDIDSYTREHIVRIEERAATAR